MTDTITGLPPELAKLIVVPPKSAGLLGEPRPHTMLDWALRCADLGLHVFPVQSFLGLPYSPKWYKEATRERGQLIEWWSEAPDADIAAIPEKSGHFVLIATCEEGRESLDELEQRCGGRFDPAPEFQYENRWGDLHFWFKGRALTSHDQLGAGLHVIGDGHFVYLFPSLAPDPVWSGRYRFTPIK